jgi:hypothetical protein
MASEKCRLLFEKHIEKRALYFLEQCRGTLSKCREKNRVGISRS